MCADSFVELVPHFHTVDSSSQAQVVGLVTSTLHPEPFYQALCFCLWSWFLCKQRQVKASIAAFDVIFLLSCCFHIRSLPYYRNVTKYSTHSVIAEYKDIILLCHLSTNKGKRIVLIPRNKVSLRINWFQFKAVTMLRLIFWSWKLLRNRKPHKWIIGKSFVLLIISSELRYNQIVQSLCNLLSL